MSRPTNETAPVGGASKDAVNQSQLVQDLRGVWVPCVGPLSAYVAGSPLSPWRPCLSCCTSARHSSCAVCVYLAARQASLASRGTGTVYVAGLCVFSASQSLLFGPPYTDRLSVCVLPTPFCGGSTPCVFGFMAASCLHVAPLCCARALRRAAWCFVSRVCWDAAAVVCRHPPRREVRKFAAAVGWVVLCPSHFLYVGDRWPPARCWCQGQPVGCGDVSSFVCRVRFSFCCQRLV